ncbi:DNA polymerase subunit Cdc27 [Gymnopilus junonius]|uniref:DNA polymerase delta subunit 3 n=1 Tax=Gymnopilus junonius TaxID=109634 RepID=A0A9P5NUZ3_GYMJU|nr:DNA polymerase subunit Cdc27 [Gymnopilus junonius]
MTTQVINDYLTKQIFIEKNIVTYRSLSRHFSIHVNVAKNELATYHHDAPYQSQTCLATILLSGTPRKLSKYRNQNEEDEDINMDATQSTNADDDEYESEEVPQIKITIVNEKDLEDAKASYDDIFSIHIYSLSPAPLHDVDLICEPTYSVRSTDRVKGPEFATTVGRLVGRGIKMGPTRKRALPPVAGPSNLKRPAAPEAKPAVKEEVKEKPAAAPATEKPKPTGKINFFKKAADKPKEPKVIKKDVKLVKEEPVEEKKRMFFQKASSKPASRASSPAPSVVSSKAEKAQPSRGLKRKSSAGLESREKSPENPAPPKAESNTRVKRRAIVSDDESDAPSIKAPRRKARSSLKVESTENSEAEREVMAIMDLHDDQVEKVSRVPSTNASSNEHEENDEAGSPAQDEDIEMEDDTPAKPKVTKKRKPKMVVPVGRNGLKKVKVTKSRKVKDANGYMVTEDYTDWESVDENAGPPAPKTKPRAKAKVTEVKKEEEEETPLAPVKEKEEEIAPKKTVTKSTSTGAKAKSGAKGGNTKTQKGLMNFFVPKKAAS